MKVVLDTSAVIQLIEQKHPGVVAELRNASEAPSISVVTLGELAVGWSTFAEDSPRRRTYLAACRLRTVDIAANPLRPEPAGVLASFGVCRGAGIKGNDAWIAATAHAAGSTLVTFDATLANRYRSVGTCRLLGISETEEVS